MAKGKHRKPSRLTTQGTHGTALLGTMAVAGAVAVPAAFGQATTTPVALTFADAQTNQLTPAQVAILQGGPANPSAVAQEERDEQRASRGRQRAPLTTVTPSVAPQDAQMMSVLFRNADKARQAEAKAAAIAAAKRKDAEEQAALDKAAALAQAKEEAARVAAQQKAAQEAAARAAAQQAAREKANRDKAAERARSGPNPTADENRALAHQMMLAAGFPETEWTCLDTLWTRESQFDEDAINPSSGAGGIPQALPATKMGPGWEDNPAIQIAWGLSYIAKRYGAPCAALDASDRQNWY